MRQGVLEVEGPAPATTLLISPSLAVKAVTAIRMNMAGEPTLETMAAMGEITITVGDDRMALQIRVDRARIVLVVTTLGAEAVRILAKTMAREAVLDGTTAQTLELRAIKASEEELTQSAMESTTTKAFSFRR